MFVWLHNHTAHAPFAVIFGFFAHRPQTKNFLVFALRSVSKKGRELSSGLIGRKKKKNRDADACECRGRLRRHTFLKMRFEAYTMKILLAEAAVRVPGICSRSGAGALIVTVVLEIEMHLCK